MSENNMADEPEELQNLFKTISFEVTEGLRKVKDMVFINEVLLQEVCKVKSEDIFCFQSFPAQGKYDFHLHDEPLCTAALERLEAAAGTEALRGIDFCLGSVRREVPITVHVPNPLCSQEAIVSFLQIYCDKVGKGEKLHNSLGLWNGKITFGVLLKLDDTGRIGNTLHPPAVFSIWDCRASLSYPRQPKFCAICCTSGHCKAECSNAPCKYCRDKGHDEEDCEFNFENDVDGWEAADMADMDEFKEVPDRGLFT